MKVYTCFGCQMTDMAETFAELVEDDWSAKKVTVSTVEQPEPRTVTLHFCGTDCRDYVLESLTLDDDPVSASAEKTMRGW